MGVLTLHPDALANANVVAAVAADLDDAAFKALDALARYKFMMFGYWAAIWVHQNRTGGFRRVSPFRALVLLARELAPQQQSSAHGS